MRAGVYVIQRRVGDLFSCLDQGLLHNKAPVNWIGVSKFLSRGLSRFEALG